tara:strand:+ start:1341 stop:1649 length:309 start_codon:yes stop_codon:yes gene_type:complete
MVTENAIPPHVQKDLDSGFIMTDEDDGFQRCKKLSDTCFLYRCDVNGEVYEDTIDVTKLDQKEAISGYYDSVESLIEENGQADANMLIAECHFEHTCPMQLP